VLGVAVLTGVGAACARWVDAGNGGNAGAGAETAGLNPGKN
jgi:hypothetical protein